MFRTESLLMRFLKRIGMESMAWSLRRLHCPVSREALVLEVGSGGSPYARANVLLDAYEVTGERHWVPLKVDRPMVLGFVEKLPFKDQAFDFVIASHVLEHSARPEQFLSELQRVAKAGYIEVPDAFMERINPYKDHRLEITCRNSRLIIRKKPGWIVERDTVELYEYKVKPLLTGEVIPRRPFAFHVCYFWDKKIDFTVMNPEVDASWKAADPETSVASPVRSVRARLRGFVLDIARYFLSQRRRNRRIDLFGLLLCPSCHADSLSRAADGIHCRHCDATYETRNGIPALYPHREKNTEYPV